MTTPKLRVGISKKPVLRESNGAHRQIEHRTVEIDELCELIQAGHALGAITAGHHVYENFIGRQDIQLDIDSDMGNRALHYYTQNPFFKRFGYLAYTTRTPGHCRLMFRLSKQITNPVQYARYADALITMFGADHSAVSCVQLWYTYPGCDVAIVGQTLPLTELERLTRQYSDSDDYTAPAPLADPETLLQQAIDSPDGRNVSGYNLAVSLRKLNTPIEIAKRYLERYQAIVCNRGDHPYTWQECEDSLNSAYRHRKTFDLSSIEQAKQAVVTGVVDLPVNVRRTAVAVLDAMTQVGRTTNVELSLRQISRAAGGHIEPMMVRRHVEVIQRAGLLRVQRGIDGKPNVYTLMIGGAIRANDTQQTGGGEGGNTPRPTHPVCCVSKLHIAPQTVTGMFGALQHTATAEPNAKIHPQLATTEADYLVRLGSGWQACMSVLVAADDHTVTGVGELATLANVSARIAGNCVRSMQLVDLVEVERVKNGSARGGGASKSIRLLPGWREKIRDIEPMLTTYGRDLLRQQKYLEQRESYHAHIATHADSDETRATHDALVERARAEKQVIAIQLDAAAQERREAAQRLGLDPNTAPPISMTVDKPSRKRRQPVVEHKNGRFVTRPIIPDEAKITEVRNRKTQRETLAASSVEVKTVQRITLGSIHDASFGTVETVTVAAQRLGVAL